MKKIILLLCALLVLSANASAQTYKYQIGTSFLVSNQVYIIASYAGDQYSLAYDSGNGVIAYMNQPVSVVDSWAPITETWAQQAKHQLSIVTLSLVNGQIQPQIFGDVNDDGQVTIVDTMYIGENFAGSRSLNTWQLHACDVNADGQCDVVDQMFIAQYTVGDYSNAPRWRIGAQITDYYNVPAPTATPAPTPTTTSTQTQSVRVNSNPIGAGVYYDGVYQGTADSNGIYLTGNIGSSHQIKATKAGYQDQVFDYTFQTGAASLDFVLVPTTSTPAPTATPSTTTSTPLPPVTITPTPIVTIPPLPTLPPATNQAPGFGIVGAGMALILIGTLARRNKK